MRKLLFIPFTLLLAFQGLSQSFKTSVFVSPNISWISSTSEKIKHDKIGYGFSLAVREEFYFPKLLSIASEIGYLNIGASFQSPNYQFTIPEIIHYTRNAIRENFIEIPLLIKLRTASESENFYFFTGLGLSYNFSNSRKVEVISYDMNNSNDKQITLSTEGNFIFNNKKSFGQFYLVGIGKNFVIKEKIFAGELRYRQDLNNWNYPTANDPVDREFNIRNSCITLNLGFVF